MATRDFFAMIKPDGVRRGLVGEIISRFERKGFLLRDVKMLTPSRPLIEQHYEEHEGKTFFDDLLTFTTSGPVVAMRMHGNLHVARQLIGATAPWSAESWTIRGELSSSLPDNLIHCSDTNESAGRELELWFPIDE